MDCGVGTSGGASFGRKVNGCPGICTACSRRTSKGSAGTTETRIDCARHARMFFDRPDYDLASAAPGSFAITPINGMINALNRDYENMTAMIFGAAPDFAEILASIGKIERIANSTTPS